MSKKPYISVVIPAYNEEDYLPYCLKSLKNQKFSDFEIIVVDNNSTDKTAAIARKFGAKVIKEPKQGYIFALNTGMGKAKGEIIAVTDADTNVSYQWLDVINKCFKKKSVIAMTGSASIETESRLYQRFTYTLFNLFLGINFLIGKPHIVGFNFAVRNEIFKRIGGLDKRFYMSCDVDLGLRLKQYGEIVFDKKAYVKTVSRRWDNNFKLAFWQYAISYLFTVWLRRPPRVIQAVIR